MDMTKHSITNLAEVGYTVEDIDGTDAYGNPWRYRVTGRRGAVWFIKEQTVNAPTPFLEAYKTQDKRADRTSIGRYFSFRIIGGILYGVEKRSR